MSPHDEAALTKECEALRRTIHDLNVRAGSVEQRLAVLTAKCLEMTENERIGAAGLTPLVEAMIPAIREVIRQEMKCLKPLDEPGMGLPKWRRSPAGGSAPARSEIGSVGGKSTANRTATKCDCPRARLTPCERTNGSPCVSRTHPRCRRRRDREIAQPVAPMTMCRI